MASTEDAVRAAIVTAIQGIAVSDLGFDAANGNVKTYLLDWARAEEVSRYLMAKCGGQKVIRAWAVQVLGSDMFEYTEDKTRRVYDIQVVGYYDVGSDDSIGVNTLITHARKVRQAIRNIKTTLSSTVDFVSSQDMLSISRERNIDEGIGEMLVGVMRYEAERAFPDF